MQNQIFNTPFEMGLRLILLMNSTSREFFSIDRILAIDFMACYGKVFGISDMNLHGDNNYMYGEIASRRYLLHEAIKGVVINGYISVILQNGYQYYITDDGIDIARKFSCPYAQTYIRIVKRAIKKYDKYEDAILLKLIQRHK